MFAKKHNPGTWLSSTGILHSVVANQRSPNVHKILRSVGVNRGQLLCLQAGGGGGAGVRMNLS